MNNIFKFIINLEKDNDRLNSTIKELKKINFDNHYTVFKAKDSNYCQKNYYNYCCEQVIDNINNPISTLIIPCYEALACAVSHIEVLKIITNNNIKEAFIIEDDIKIVDPEKLLIYLNTKLKIFIKQHNDDEIFITFGSNIYNCENKLLFNHNNRTNDLVTIKGPIIGTHFYYINNKMAKFFIKCINSN